MAPRPEKRQSASTTHVKTQPVHRRPFGSRRLSLLPFSRRLVNASLDQLLYTYRKPRDFTVNISILQRMNLLIIQKELVDISSAIDRTGDISRQQQATLRQSLSDYATALRDWQLSLEASSAAQGDFLQDPFIITSAKNLQRSLFVDAGLLTIESAGELTKEVDHDGPMLPGDSRKWFNKDRTIAAFQERLIMGLFGGVALIAPMLLMVLHKNILTTLLTTSLSVVFVAVVVAWRSTESAETVLGIVAAYAAVLVVFVGTST